MAFRLHEALGTQNERYFVAATPPAHSLACLRIDDPVTAAAARLATGVGGLAPHRTGFAPAGRQTEFHDVIASSLPSDQPCLVAPCNNAAWRYRRAIFEPADDRAAQRGAHRIGLWADEDAAEPAAGRRTYVSGEYAAFFVPADTGRVTFDVRKAPALAAQTVTVRVDGRVVDRRSLTDDAWHTLDYAVEARDADNSPLCVELLVSPAWRTADDNPRGVLLRGDL